VDKFVVAIEDVGNTVSSTIPIALAQSVESKRLQRGARVVLVGFGVGYSWAACTLTWGPP
jgi:3-oxoacyl-[acyl-carrier-protein] synthase-3